MPRVKSSPRLSIHDRPGRAKLLLRRLRRHARLGLGTVAGLGVLTLIWVAMRTAEPGGAIAAAQARIDAMAARAGLRVQHVEVEGRVNTSEPMLRAAIGVARDDAILAVKLGPMKQRIESLMSVQSATVERRLPDRIIVRLTEREPFAVWQNQGKFSLVDRAGKVVELDLTESRGLPLIVGAGAPVAAAPLLDALNANPALLARMVAAIRVGERRWNLRLTNGTDILLPEGQETVAIKRLMALHQDQGLLDRPLKSVDMRLPDRLVVRPQTEAKPDDPQPARGSVPRKPT
jgi:cell division protein FtsQ